MRQPKIYIKLPSGGEFWPKGSIDMPENGELPVFSMTAKDELMIKIPDALVNGQAIVDVIQNCIPSIKNAWSTPNIDLDVILIAIRIATYGEKMKVPLDTGDLDVEYDVDLRNIMAELTNQITWDATVPVNTDLTVYIKPSTYKQMTESALQSFESQKIMQIANDTEMADEEKLKLFNTAFNKLNNVTVGLVNDAVFQIESSQGSTDNPQFIKEFMENADKEIFDSIKSHIEKMREINSIKPLQVAPTPEMLAAGWEDKIVEVPLVFDASTFFA